MSAMSRLRLALFGNEPKMHRMLQYWAATAVLYALCVALLLAQLRYGLVEPGAAAPLVWYCSSGTLFIYVLVRASFRLGIAPRTVAVLEGLFGISCTMWVYALGGPLRAAFLVMLVVVIAFCTLSLRPRQTPLLAGVAVLGMGATMWWLQAHDPARFPPAVEALTFACMSAALVAIALLTGEMNKLRARLKRQKEELLAAVATIRSLATLDDLTSLVNRRYMNEVLEAEERRLARGALTCIALLDIDFFKAVNDRHGHAGGDAVLRGFAGAARAELRTSDVLARWGGEEFLLMLPETGLDEAAAVLDRIAARAAKLRVPGLELERPLSFSGGLAARREGEPFADTINRADKALYQAKAAGRDRVMLA